MRQRVNLLLSHGHPDAANYTIGRLTDEASHVTDRMNAMVITEALAFQTAYISARVEGGQKLMGDFIKRLMPGD